VILVRQVFQAKFGRGGALAAAMTESSAAIAQRISSGGRWRVLTDLSGAFDTVVLEIESESLAAWEQQRAQLFQLPELQEAIVRYVELIASGRNELYTIEAQG